MPKKKRGPKISKTALRRKAKRQPRTKSGRFTKRRRSKKR